MLACRSVQIWIKAVLDRSGLRYKLISAPCKEYIFFDRSQPFLEFDFTSVHEGVLADSF